VTSNLVLGRTVRAVFVRILWGVAVALGGSFAIAVLVRSNTYVLPGIPWFLLPVVVLCLILLGRSEPGKPPVPPGSKSWNAVWISVALVIALSVVATVFTGLPQISAGTARLPGDAIEGTPLFRALASFAFVAGGAIVEEAAVRGQVQLRLSQLASPVLAEAIADVLFVLLHFLRFGAPGEMLFVSILSLACGRVAALTQSVRWPAAIHLGVNSLVLVVVLANR
jgi:membrane protease YdiL (CAAX protease family)